MIFPRGPRSTTGTTAGTETAFLMLFMIDSGEHYGSLLAETRSQQRASSTARASSLRTSVVPGASTRGKKVKGRKRHLLVDTMGLILVAMITPASMQDRDGAVSLLKEAHREYPTLRQVWADGAYNGGVIDEIRAETGLSIQIVKRSDGQQGFTVLPRRWVAERTYGWLNKWRLLNKEYERTVESSRADVIHAMTAVMLRRLTSRPDSRKEAREP